MQLDLDTLIQADQWCYSNVETVIIVADFLSAPNLPAAPEGTRTQAFNLWAKHMKLRSGGVDSWNIVSANPNYLVTTILILIHFIFT